MKSRVHPKYKTKYRVENWPEYERALVRRGDITLWLSSSAVEAWKPRRVGLPGGHHHDERAHQGIGNERIERFRAVGDGEVVCDERLGGLLKCYRRAA